MLKSLRGRNLALLISVVLLGQLLSTTLVALLVIRPQAERVAQIVAGNIAAISMTMAALPKPQRAALIARINGSGDIRILPGTAVPPEDRGVPSALEIVFMRAFARAVGSKDVVLWRGGLTGQLWVRVTLGDAHYWVSYDRPSGITPSGALLASVASAVLLALGAGIVLQRRIGLPLRRLAEAADAVRGDTVPQPLATDGPVEISAVAGSFNRMAQRLAAYEASRTLMLAGISHDLRTPLAKIRLALALGPGMEPKLGTLVDEQFDRLDAMLGQFLDFGRWMDGEKAEQGDIIAIVCAAVAETDRAVTIAAPATLAALVRPQALQRGVVNMLRNAVRHGAPPISLVVSTVDGAIDIAVEDRGPGVPETLLASLDQPFVHGGTDGSIGLGLAIVRHVAVVHEGRLILANRDSGGFSQRLRFRLREEGRL